MNLIPLNGRIIAKKVEIEQKKGALLLLEKKEQNIVQVLAVEEGKHLDNGVFVPSIVKVGDKIMIEKYRGQDVTFDNEEYVIIKSEDVIAIVN